MAQIYFQNALVSISNQNITEQISSIQIMSDLNSELETELTSKKTREQFTK